MTKRQLFQFKINITQLLALTTMTAVLIHIASSPLNDQPYWKNTTLVYEQPPVPKAFLILPEESPGHPVVTNSKRYDSPSELFLANHRVGWEWVRLLFFKSEPWEVDFEEFDFYEEYDLSKLSFRTNYDHVAYAQKTGREDCRQQIGQLLNTYLEVELREKIAYSSAWHYAPWLAILALSILVLLRPWPNKP